MLFPVPGRRYDVAMGQTEVKQLVDDLANGRLTTSDLTAALTASGSADLGDTTLDLDRRRRCGFPEVVYAEGKSSETLLRIVGSLLESNQSVLATRVSLEKSEALLGAYPNGRYHPTARTFRIDIGPRDVRGRVTVVTAGTSDLPIAEEVRETLDWMGVETTMVHDVGVAGPHRLVYQLDKLRGADAIVVVAGMEGALPSIVGGHVDCPVIAVPTSVGYGASLGGIAALLGMLNSCAANVVVVNIDGGFKGGYVAGTIARRRHHEVPS